MLAPGWECWKEIRRWGVPAFCLAVTAHVANHLAFLVSALSFLV